MWPLWGLDFADPRLSELLAEPAPVTLEIGFGNGASLAAMAAARPDRRFIGIEVHRPGVGQLLQQIEQLSLTNIHILCHDAVEVLRESIPENSLDGVQIFFPDPWPKKRHHKRRLIQSEFIQLVCARLRPEGQIHLATDWQDYAQQMLAVLDAEPGLKNDAGRGCFSPRPEYRPLTKFEQRGQRLGHGVWDLMYTRAALT